MTAAMIAVDAVNPFSVFTLVATAVGALAAAYVGVKGLAGKKQVDRFQLNLTATDQSVDHLKAALERSDIDLARMAEQIKALKETIADNYQRHSDSSKRCNAKINKLVTIVRNLGGELPDEFIGDHDDS